MPKQNQRIQIKTGDIKITEEGDFTYIEFPFSSEYPVKRYFGFEVLSHAAGAMRMERFAAYMPHLFNHDLDLQIGVVVEAWVGEDKRGYVKSKVARSEFAKEKLQDIKDEILMNVSFWYEIKDMRLLKEEDGVPTYVVTDYEPLEVSSVTVPADYTVGMGRGVDNKSNSEIDFEVEIPDPPPAVEEDNENENKTVTDERSVQVDLKLTTKKGVGNMNEEQKKEQLRIMSILALVEKHGEADLGKRFIEEGKTAGDFALELSSKLGGKFERVNDKQLDLSEKDKKRYSIVRAINAAIGGKWDNAGFEKECSEEIAKQYGRAVSGSGFFMPSEFLKRAPYAAGASATGGVTVQTNVAPELIDVLRPKSVLLKAGIRTLTGLVGNVSIPRKNGRSSSYWIAENGTITESEATFDQVALSPKTIAALSSVSKQLLTQSSLSADAFIVADMLDELAVGIDAAGLVGTNAGGQPKGLINQSGIGSVVIGANGGALNYDHLIDLETAVTDQNADAETMSYITNSRQVGNIKKLKNLEGSYLLPNLQLGKQGEVNGYALHRTNNVPRNLAKGSGTNLSAVFFGDWSQMVMAQWMAGIEIVVNPFGPSFAKGGVDIRAMSMCDFNIRHNESFAAITDAT